METLQGMKRTHHCGVLRKTDVGQEVVLCGWVSRRRDHGGLIFVDMRDRSGFVQVVFDEAAMNEGTFHKAESLRNEFCIAVRGKIRARSEETINPNIETGEIEVVCAELRILNPSKTPPFYIQDGVDVDEMVRLKYRYLDLRRPEMQKNIILRHRVTKIMRDFFDRNGFLEIETPMLCKSTPEGARDFLVPSRVNPGEFYALPQSPQIFKQILQVAGFEKYFQIVRCFRDEDLRADRQPEFTQIDCEMSFVDREDILTTFEGLAKHLFRSILGKTFEGDFPRITWHEAMAKYGSDKPDIRFGMTFNDITKLAQGKGFGVFDSAEYIGAICAEGCAGYTRKQLDALTEFVKRPQIGAKGMVYVRCEADGSYKSSVDKFYSQEDLAQWAAACGAKAGDLLLILSGVRKNTLSALCELRLEMGNRLGLRPHDQFAPLWVIDFPLLEWDDETQRFYAMHHPFTSPNSEDIDLFDTDPGKIRANAYDFVMNGVEVGGGSIRIFDADLQEKMFKVLGFSKEEAEKQFGFLINAFKYGAPPHGGIAFGFDRWCALFGGADSIRDYIAFPKNNSGRDVMIESPSTISDAQLEELSLKVVTKE